MVLNVEFLRTYGFKQERFPDGLYWIRRYTSEYYLQANESLDQFYEDDNWVEELTATEFVATIMRHEQAINQ
jgi:hypothetical protein